MRIERSIDKEHLFPLFLLATLLGFLEDQPTMRGTHGGQLAAVHVLDGLAGHLLVLKRHERKSARQFRVIITNNAHVRNDA